jgi:hypothetical protein
MNKTKIKQLFLCYFSRIKPHLDVIVPWSYALVTFFFYYPYQIFFPFIFWMTITTYKNRIIHQPKYLNFKNPQQFKTWLNSLLLIPGIIFFMIFPFLWIDQPFDYYQAHIRFSCLRLHYLNEYDYFQYTHLDTPNSFKILTQQIQKCHAYNAKPFLIYASGWTTVMTNPLSYPEHIFGQRSSEAISTLKVLYPNMALPKEPFDKDEHF